MNHFKVSKEMNNVPDDHFDIYLKVMSIMSKDEYRQRQTDSGINPYSDVEVIDFMKMLLKEAAE